MRLIACCQTGGTGRVAWEAGAWLAPRSGAPGGSGGSSPRANTAGQGEAADRRRAALPAPSPQATSRRLAERLDRRRAVAGLGDFVRPDRGLGDRRRRPGERPGGRLVRAAVPRPPRPGAAAPL